MFKLCSSTEKWALLWKDLICPEKLQLDQMKNLQLYFFLFESRRLLTLGPNTGNIWETVIEN